MSDYDDENGVPICERCGEPCHWCEIDMADREEEDEDA